MSTRKDASQLQPESEVELKLCGSLYISVRDGFVWLGFTSDISVGSSQGSRAWEVSPIYMIIGTRVGWTV